MSTEQIPNGTGSTPSGPLQKLAEYAVWIPIFSALLYFYCWVFEYASCLSLHIPANLIEPSTSTILLYVGIFLTGTIILILTGMLLFLILAETDLKVILFCLIVIPFILIGFYYLANHELNLQGIKWMVIDGLAFDVLIVFVGWLIRKLKKRRTWERIFNLFFYDGAEILVQTISGIKKAYLTLYMVGALFLTVGLGNLYVKWYPPKYKVVGKEHFVLIKKYGEIVICARYDSTPTRASVWRRSREVGHSCAGER